MLVDLLDLASLRNVIKQSYIPSIAKFFKIQTKYKGSVIKTHMRTCDINFQSIA